MREPIAVRRCANVSRPAPSMTYCSTPRAACSMTRSSTKRSRATSDARKGLVNGLMSGRLCHPSSGAASFNPISSSNTCGGESTSTCSARHKAVRTAVLSGAATCLPMKLGNDLYRADNVLIELEQLVGRNPKLLADRSADSLHFVTREVIRAYSKTSDVPGATFLYVPIPRNPRCVFFLQDRIEDGLMGETRRKLLPP